MNSVRLVVFNRRTGKSVVNDTYRGENCGVRLLGKHGYLYTVKRLYLSLDVNNGVTEVAETINQVEYTLTANVP